MKKVMVAAALGAGIGFGGAALLTAPTGVSSSAMAQSSSAKDTYELLGLLGDILDRVEKSYVEEADNEKLVEAAINGMLASLDPHSGYLPPEHFTEMQQETQGKFGGLGIEVTMEDGFVKVVTPIDDTPAARAGVQSGDFITHLDGEAVLGMTLGDAVDRMRGAPGEPITITVAREGLDEPLQIEIVRDEITVLPVRARLEGEIGVVRITKFNRNTSSDLTEKIAELKTELDGEMKGIVLDLRNNPGGVLQEAIAVSDAFLEKGSIVSTRGRDLDQAEHYNATPGDLAGGLPMVVLINNGSASASEIVAGALQDHRRAIVVGTKSFGKGSVQTVVGLRNGAGIKLTTSRYYTPSGRSIQALGIDPDIVVEQLTVETPETPERPRRNENSLRGHLDNDTEENASDGDAEGAEGATRATLRGEDYQLSYALDLLDGVAAITALKE
ncbi:MAG: S41 family peptidase [Pseudomonadota bacterium]